MPDRSRRARREPPSMWDHILSHPVEVAAGAWWAVLGAAILTGFLPGAPSISRGIDALPWPMALILALSVGGGGVVTIIGACWPGERLDTAWKLERTGLWLAIGGWASYVMILITSASTAIFTLSMALSMITGAGLRLIAIRGVERDTRQDVTDTGLGFES